jgi:hypothetical protein
MLQRWVHTGFWWRKLRKGYHVEEPDEGKRVLLKRIFKKCDRGRDWVHLAQDRNRWRALVNTVMNLRIPYNAENFLIS